jgi:hypothetical protein
MAQVVWAKTVMDSVRIGTLLEHPDPALVELVKLIQVKEEPTAITVTPSQVT